LDLLKNIEDILVRDN